MANRVSKYIKNVNKELGQTQNASEKAIKARNNANIVKLPSGKTIKVGPSEKEANKKVKSERGQLLGAVLQGRRYDESGKLITKSSNKSKSATKSQSKKTNKKKTLDDFLKQGKTPPTKGKKAPPAYDVVSGDMGYTKPTKKNPPKKIKK